MIVEIAAFDLVDGNRYVPGEVMGRMYRDALADARQGDVYKNCGTEDGDINVLARIQVVVRDPLPGPPPIDWRSDGYPQMRAIVRVGAGGRISIDNARLMFALKDLVVARIDAVDPPFGEWYPCPSAHRPSDVG